MQWITNRNGNWIGKVREKLKEWKKNNNELTCKNEKEPRNNKWKRTKKGLMNTNKENMNKIEQK